MTKVEDVEYAYHWSPRERLPSIKRLGLVPGRLSRDGLWRPPFVCFSLNPGMAWDLSGRLDESGTFDLWEVRLDDLDRYEAIFECYPGVMPPLHYTKELRVYHRIYKRDLVWVAERTIGN